MNGIETISNIFKSFIGSLLSLKLCSLINKLIIAIVATLANSDGWIVNNPKLYQLRAPLTIGAILLGTKNIPTSKTRENKYIPMVNRSIRSTGIFCSIYIIPKPIR